MRKNILYIFLKRDELNACQIQRSESDFVIYRVWNLRESECKYTGEILECIEYFKKIYFDLYIEQE